MSQAELTHALGDNVDQELLVRNNLGCFLEELSRHMAQGSDGAGCFRRELKNGGRAGGESGGREWRRDHENGALTLRAVEMVVNRFCSDNPSVDLVAHKIDNRAWVLAREASA